MDLEEVGTVIVMGKGVRREWAREAKGWKEVPITNQFHSLPSPQSLHSPPLLPTPKNPGRSNPPDPNLNRPRHNVRFPLPRQGPRYNRRSRHNDTSPSSPLTTPYNPNVKARNSPPTTAARTVLRRTVRFQAPFPPPLLPP